MRSGQRAVKCSSRFRSRSTNTSGEKTEKRRPSSLAQTGRKPEDARLVAKSAGAGRYRPAKSRKNADRGRKVVRVTQRRQEQERERSCEEQGCLGGSLKFSDLSIAHAMFLALKLDAAGEQAIHTSVHSIALYIYLFLFIASIHQHC